MRVNLELTRKKEKGNIKWWGNEINKSTTWTSNFFIGIDCIFLEDSWCMYGVCAVLKLQRLVLNWVIDQPVGPTGRRRIGSDALIRLPSREKKIKKERGKKTKREIEKLKMTNKEGGNKINAWILFWKRITQLVYYENTHVGSLWRFPSSSIR